MNNNKVADVDNAGIANGTNIQLWDFNDSGAQKFNIIPVKEGYYKILNAASKKALDVAGGMKGSGVNVWLYDDNETDAQLWRFYQTGDYYFIKNKLGYYMDVRGGYTTNGTNIQVYTGNSTKAQKFRLDSTTYTVNNNSTTTYYVTTKAGLLLRNSPSTYGAIITTMPYASELQVYSIANGWASCTYNGNKGYCSASYISATQPKQNTSNTTNNNNNNSNNNYTGVNVYGYAQPMSVPGASWGTYNISGNNGCKHDIYSRRC